MAKRPRRSRKMTQVSLQTLHTLRGNNKHQSDVEKSLELIYGEEKMDGRGTFERRSSHRWLWATLTVVFLGLFLGVIGWTGFALFRPFRVLAEPGLTLRINGPTTLKFGAPQTYQIQWMNQGKRVLSQARIRLVIPSEFDLQKHVPAMKDSKKMEWDLGALDPGAQGSVEVQGIFAGSLGTQSAFQAIGSYRPINFNRDFEFVAVHAVVCAESVIEGQVSVPTKILSGDPVTLRYTLVNRGSQVQAGLIARFTIPNGFVVTTPAATSSGQVISIPLPPLMPNVSSSVQLVGSFAAGVSGEMPFMIETGRMKSGNLVIAQKTETKLPVLAGNLALHAVVNGSSSDQTIAEGDTLHLTIGYQNTSIEPLRQMSLKLGIETVVDGKSSAATSLIDWPRVKAFPSGVTSTKTQIQTLKYTATEAGDLELLSPNAEGSIEITLPTLAVKKGTKDAKIVVTLEGTVPVVGQTKVNRTVHAQPINLRYRSDADLAMEARYYTEEGAPLGSGPLPPKVASTTAYRVIWSVSKHLHGLEKVFVKAKLPPTAQWGGKAASNAGMLKYDPDTRIVEWEIDQVGDTRDRIEANFEIQVTPDANDVGRFAQIMGEATFDARDALLKETIHKTKPALTTDLQEDEGARGKGVVKK